MKLSIFQIHIALNDKFKININNVYKYLATSKYDNISIFKISDNIENIKIKKRNAFLQIKYDIFTMDNKKYKFRTKNFYSKHYICLIEDDLYELFAHKKSKYTIQKNSVQIASMEKIGNYWDDNIGYRIIADDTANPEFLSTFCLIINNFTNKEFKNNILFDFNLLRMEVFEFDSNWKPNINQ